MLDTLRTRLTLLRTHPLARRQQLRTLARFAKAEILNRAMGRSFLFRHDFGITLIVDRHLHSSRGHYFFGIHEFDEELFLIHFLRPNELFIDVGANLGVFSILTAKATGAHVMAFEPSPNSASVMKTQIALNQLQDRIQVVEACAGDCCGEAAIQNSVRMDNSVILGDPAISPDLVAVPMVMIDDIVQPKVSCVMKMDVEGFEKQALDGALRLLGNSALRALIVETRDICTRFGENAAEIAEMIVGHGFHPARYDPLARALTAADSSDGSLARDDANTIYIRDFNEARQRLSAAPRRRIFGLLV
jgi:FkbM family methyltransferase